MNKRSKFIYVFTILSFIIILTSCNLPINKKSKENNFYYTNLLCENIASQNNYKSTIVDTNFYKEEILDTKNCSVLNNFLHCLKPKHFISKKPKDLPNKPYYKILLTFKDSKFVINIFNKKYASVNPWDGYLEMDFIDMSSIPESYNLYNLCDYIIPKE